MAGMVLLPHVMVTAGGYKKKTIGNTDDHRLTTLVNSASTAPPIGLLPKGTEFCHTSNILLMGRQRRRALWRLYFNSSAVGWSGIGRCWLVGRSTIRVAGL
jgi:hypothetical protein